MRALRIVLTVGAIALFLFCGCNGAIPGFDAMVFLLIGWSAFLIDVIPQMDVSVWLVGSCLIYALLTIGLIQLVGSWSRKSTQGRADQHRRWRWGSSVRIFVAFVLLFASGVAATGLWRQMQWLAMSGHPTFENGGERALRVDCEWKLQLIWQELRAFANEHHGSYPTDMQDLAKQSRFAHLLTLESSWSRTEKQRRSHYVGAGRAAGTDPTAVVMFDDLSDHDGIGIHVLHDDGSVEWFETPDAQKMEESLKKLESPRAPTTSPSSVHQPAPQPR